MCSSLNLPEDLAFKKLAVAVLGIIEGPLEPAHIGKILNVMLVDFMVKHDPGEGAGVTVRTHYAVRPCVAPTSAGECTGLVLAVQLIAAVMRRWSAVQGLRCSPGADRAALAAAGGR